MDKSLGLHAEIELGRWHVYLSRLRSDDVGRVHQPMILARFICSYDPKLSVCLLTQVPFVLNRVPEVCRSTRLVSFVLSYVKRHWRNALFPKGSSIQRLVSTALPDANSPSVSFLPFALLLLSHPTNWQSTTVCLPWPTPRSRTTDLAWRPCRKNRRRLIWAMEATRTLRTAMPMPTKQPRLYGDGPESESHGSHAIGPDLRGAQETTRQPPRS